METCQEIFEVSIYILLFFCILRNLPIFLLQYFFLLRMQVSYIGTEVLFVFFHIFPIRCKQRDELQKYLVTNEVQTIIHYPIPPHKQTCFREWNDLSFPITEQIHREELSIPLNPTLTNQEIEEITTLLNRF